MAKPKISQNKIHCYLQDDGSVVGQKDKQSFHVNDMLRFKILVNGTTRKWVPKFWVDHYEKDVSQYSSVKDLDARVPLIIGLAEYFAYLSVDDSDLKEQVMAYALNALRQSAYKKYHDKRDKTEKDTYLDYECIKETHQEIIDRVFEYEDPDDPTNDNFYPEAFMYYRTKNSFAGSDGFIKNIIHTLYILLKSDDDLHFFDDCIFHLIMKAIDVSHDLVNSIYLARTERFEKEKGNFINTSLKDFLKENHLEGNALGAMFVLSRASIEDSVENISIWNTELYTTNGVIKVNNPPEKVYHYQKSQYVTSFSFSDCTTACTMLFVRLCHCICETFKVNNPRQVEWFNDEIDGILASCLGTDDFGRFLKSGKRHFSDQDLLAIHNDNRAFMKKRDFINEAVMRMYGSKEEAKSEKPLDVKLNIAEFKYFSFIYVTELVQAAVFAAELATMKNEYSAFKQETVENDEERASLYKKIEEYKSREEQEKQSIEEYVSEIDALKAKINNLEHVITLKTNQIGDLKDEVGGLKKELAQASKSKEQVIELLEEDQPQTMPSQEEMVSYLNEKQIFFVGGRWDMLDRLAEKGLFNATQMNKESQKFDKPKNPDIICYMTKFTNHPMYYHVKSNFPQDVAFSYNGTNLDKLIEELYSFGKLLDEREQSKEEALEG